MPTIDRPGLAKAILAKSSKTPDEAEDVDDVAVESAMEEFMAALESGDTKAAVMAWRDLRELS